MKRFSLPIPSSWRNAKRLPIPTHAELVERVAVLMERVARQDVKLRRLERLLGAEGRTGILEQFEADRNRFLSPALGRPWQEEVGLAPVAVSARPWVLEGWRNANGECWWSPQKGPAYWRMVNPTFVQAGWLLPHYAILAIPSPEGDQR